MVVQVLSRASFIAQSGHRCKLEAVIVLSDRERSRASQELVHRYLPPTNKLSRCGDCVCVCGTVRLFHFLVSSFLGSCVHRSGFVVSSKIIEATSIGVLNMLRLSAVAARAALRLSMGAARRGASLNRLHRSIRTAARRLPLAAARAGAPPQFVSTVGKQFYSVR